MSKDSEIISKLSDLEESSDQKIANELDTNESQTRPIKLSCLETNPIVAKTVYVKQKVK